jgi:hypothetical protein
VQIRPFENSSKRRAFRALSGRACLLGSLSGLVVDSSARCRAGLISVVVRAYLTDLAAYGVNGDGHREVLGLQVTSVQDGASCWDCFRGLTVRGLTVVRLVTPQV